MPRFISYAADSSTVVQDHSISSLWGISTTNIIKSLLHQLCLMGFILSVCVCKQNISKKYFNPFPSFWVEPLTWGYMILKCSLRDKIYILVQKLFGIHFSSTLLYADVSFVFLKNVIVH